MVESGNYTLKRARKMMPSLAETFLKQSGAIAATKIRIFSPYDRKVDPYSEVCSYLFDRRGKITDASPQISIYTTVQPEKRGRNVEVQLWASHDSLHPLLVELGRHLRDKAKVMVNLSI